MRTTLITPRRLKQLAGDKVFQRGQVYHERGHVNSVHERDTSVRAWVRGTGTYQVTLSEHAGRLAGDCTCPHARDGYFCKHMVATALAWLDVQDQGDQAPADPWTLVRDYLGAQPRETLLEWLLDAIEQDPQLFQRMQLRATLNPAQTQSLESTADSLRRVIEMTTCIDDSDRDDWHAAANIAEGLQNVFDSLGEILSPETAAELLDVLEYGIERTEQLIRQIDDHEFDIGSCIERFAELHVQAAQLAQLDGSELAQRLFALSMHLTPEFCSFHASTYAEALGESGLRDYERLVRERWDTLKPAAKPERWTPEMLHLAGMLRDLAHHNQDIETLVKLAAGDLSSGLNYLRAAEVLKQFGQPGLAIDWAEKGLKACPDDAFGNIRLTEFLIDAYLDAERIEDAWPLVWSCFESRPSLDEYQRLHRLATTLGRWPQERARALAVVESTQEQAGAKRTYGITRAGLNQRTRFEIALWEQDLDTAWSMANTLTLSAEQMTQLAELLSAERPSDALVLYRRVLPEIINQTNARAYAQAIELLKRVRALMHALDQQAEFRDYLARLGETHKRKRTFIALLKTL